jgi:hypothetical protein
MNPKKLVEKTLNFDSPERIPRQLWILPWAEEKYSEEIGQIQENYPDDIVSAPAAYKTPLEVTGDRYQHGTYVDEWGCRFSNPRDGTIGIVQKPLIKDWEDLERFKAPDSLLDLEKEKVNQFCRESDRFVLAGALQRPFERLQFIRTSEQALIDLVEQRGELFELLGMIHDLYCREVDVWASTDVDAIALMDDWGAQNSLLASPEIFRRIFKPMYKDYIEIAKNQGKYVFMHSDGYITDIIPDLIEIGVHSVNAQIFCMGIQELGREFRGKITFWGEIDRQELLPFGSKKDVEKAVFEVWKNLYADGGVIAQCEFGLDAKPENVLAVFETWCSIFDQS